MPSTAVSANSGKMVLAPRGFGEKRIEIETQSHRTEQ